MTKLLMFCLPMVHLSNAHQVPDSIDITHTNEEQEIARSAKVEDVENSVFSEQLGDNETIINDRKCVSKQEIVEEIEYDDVLTCNHKYKQKCHTSYNTNYQTVQQEQCTEKFKKICFLGYSDLIYNTNVTVCTESWVKNCALNGTKSCKIGYETKCSKKQEEHEVVEDVVVCKNEMINKCSDEISGYTSKTKCSQWPRKVCTISKKNVKKFIHTTSCTKEPVELCALSGCQIVPGPEECQDKIVTIVQKVPKEECNLEPYKTCILVTKLLPKLEQEKTCQDVPQEACTMSKVNQRKVTKPLLQKWCYDKEA